MSEPQPCSTVEHLKWTLATDWSTIAGGRPLQPGWEERATTWRADQVGTAAWITSLTPVQTPSWRALQQAHGAAGLATGFRTAETSHGTNRYGWYENLERRVVRKLDVDGTNDASPMARAIRGFLDIIHVHPFTDGNTRAASTWLIWSLAGADLNVPDLAPLLQLPKPPGDDAVPAAMADLLLSQ